MFYIITTLWKCLTSPRLHKIYGEGPLDAVYKPEGTEKWGDNILTSANMIFNIALYTSPLICGYVYKRGSLSSYEDLIFFATISGGIGGFLCFSMLMRAYGRMANFDYMMFLNALEHTPNQTFDVYMAGVRRYDFDFAAWPVSFQMQQNSRKSWLPSNPFKTVANADLPMYQRAIIQIMALIAIQSFGLRLIYPGSLGVLYSYLWIPLIQGRANLVEMYNGKRAKLRTADGNFIDTMTIDNRSNTANGKILVICCEGNSGFYEVGIMNAPIKNGYSTLGWNHPGFAESTGLPYPSEEHNAIDAVMQYAINELKFNPSNIVMYGWSIGGYSATWASVHYPVRGLLLDATFDDLLPMALKQMPDSWSLLVKEVVRSYVDLDVARVLRGYSGPVQLVRRTDDEIICLNPGQCGSNRGNYLLVDIIKHRHPELAAKYKDELPHYANMLVSRRPSSADHEHSLLLTTLVEYMKDFKANHCTPLPDEFVGSLMNLLLKKTN